MALSASNLAAAVGGLALLAAVLFRVVKELWWKPRCFKKHFDAQGVKGPSYKLVYGNVHELAAMTMEARSKPMKINHNILPRIFPFYDRWSQIYGRPFVFWFGSTPRLTVSDPELIKEILSNKFGHYDKPPSRPDKRELAGDGLVALRGEKWAEHRRILSPAFHVEILKAMIPTMASSVGSMLDRWQKMVANSGQEIEMFQEFRALTADVIARTAFGSSFAEGKQVFEKQHVLTVFVAEAIRSVYIPGYRFVPTAKNRQRWKLDREVKRSLLEIIEKRKQAFRSGRSEGYGSDLLGLMMTANKKELQGSQKNLSLTIEEIMDECKTFFFAGHETTSTLLTWAMMLLGAHTEWQERARKEVYEVCGMNPPDTDKINRLKVVGMVLNEALRLYPPVTLMIRKTSKAMKLGEISVPEGVELFMPILAVHHDEAIWGDDALEFKPERFSEGVARVAKSPMAFMPFGMGPRICIGMSFAMLEAKTALALILQRFPSFRLSPAYKHAPITILTLKPQYGVQIVFEAPAPA